MMRTSQLILLTATSIVACAVHAIEPIPTTTGWSGMVRIGLGGLQAETNLVAGIDAYSLDIGNARIDSLSDSPDSKSLTIPQLNLNIKYTFATQTQLYVGNSMEDIVQLDAVSVAGVRQQFSDKSIVEFGLVSSPRFGSVQVWEDPYVVGVKRVETDRTSTGIRLEYDKILGSNFGVQYTQRETDIEKELSGITQLGLSPAEAELLKREGTTKRIVGYYRFPMSGRNNYEIRVGNRNDDLDGEAMSSETNEIALVYAYLGKRYVLASNVSYGKSEFDAVNPVFNKTRDDETLGIGLFVFDKGMFNSKNWWGQASVVWLEQDSNINFYDQSSLAVIVGAQYNF